MQGARRVVRVFVSCMGPGLLVIVQQHATLDLRVLSSGRITCRAMTACFIGSRSRVAGANERHFFKACKLLPLWSAPA